MEKLYILSERSYEHWPSFDLVYEWEDELVKHIEGAQLYKRHDILFKGKHLLGSVERRFGIGLDRFLLAGKHQFRFDMVPYLGENKQNTNKTSVCIIDFFLSDEQLPAFYYSYRKVDHLYISSREVYDHLMSLNPPRKIEHLPLTLPDKYLLQEDIPAKEYDIVLVGRQNPQLQAYLDEYVKTHDIRYVTRGKIGNGHFPYFTNKGEFVGNVDTREDYFQLLRKSKIAFYSTSGTDGDRKKTNGYSQVTPKFLEQIACGCHVISRYYDNTDTAYFDLGNMSNRVNTYEEFVDAMNKCLIEDVDIQRSREYLKRHLTSTLCSVLSR